MRKRTDRRIQNTVQNLLILCLIGSALFLLSRTDLVRTEALNRVFSSVSQSAVPPSESAPDMRLPVRIAVRTGSECHAWMSETTAGDIFDDFGPLLAEALGSAGSESVVSEDEFRRALENNCVYFDFTTVLPLSVLEQWIGGSGEAQQVSARSLLLSSYQDDTLTLYAWDPDSSAYYRWSTAIPAENLRTAAEQHAGSAAEFAFLCSAPYDTLAPYTLVCQERFALYDLSAATDLSDNVKNMLLTQLEFNIHFNSRYTESNGAEVVGQGTRTLRMSPDGTVLYSSGGDEIEALRITHAGEDATVAEYLDSAWQVVSSLLAEHTGDAELYLTSVEMDRRGNAEITFGYMVNGYPISLQGDAARIEIENNHITSVSLHLRTYTVSDRSTVMLPVLQAAAAAQGSAQRELFPGYLDDGSETLPPCWLATS